jgi:hypothetical protein
MEPSCQPICQDERNFIIMMDHKPGNCSMKDISEGKSGVEWCDREAVRGSVWARFHHWCLKRKVMVFFQYVVP